MDFDPSTSIDSITKTINELATLSDSLDGLKFIAWPWTQDKAAALLQALDEANSIGFEHYDAMAFVNTKKQKAMKSVQNKTFYASRRVADALGIGGYETE